MTYTVRVVNHGPSSATGVEAIFGGCGEEGATFAGSGSGVTAGMAFGLRAGSGLEAGSGSGSGFGFGAGLAAGVLGRMAGAGSAAVSSQGVCSETNGVVSCDLDTLANGSSATIELNVIVNPVPVWVLTNTASVSSDTTDPNPANDSDSEENEIAQDLYFDVPDANFEQALIDLAIDDVPDGRALVRNARNVYSLDVQNRNIADLTGIEYFFDLISLKQPRGTRSNR